MRISREILKQAVDTIAARDAEIGYALNEMLAAGQIDAVPRTALSTTTGDPVFSFAGDQVQVRRVLFFQHGNDALAERMLVKYGELAKKQEIAHRPSSRNWFQTARDIRRAGLDLLIDHLLLHEISAYDRLADRGSASGDDSPVPARRNRSLLTKILQEKGEQNLPWDELHAANLFKGVVNIDTPAYFLQFPFCRDALRQVADLNLEFFNIGALLSCLAGGMEANLFICLVQRRLSGILLVGARNELAGEKFEIKQIATVGAQRGTGALLVAGAWLLWKHWEPKLSGLVLASEIGAQNFYETLGFRRRRTCEYALEAPRGHLLRNIVAMANHHGRLAPTVTSDIARLVHKQARLFAKRDMEAGKTSERRKAAVFFEECFRSRTYPELAIAAADALVRHSPQSSFGEKLLQAAAEYGLVRRREDAATNIDPVLLVIDDRFADHLSQITHFESGKRIRTIQSMLRDESLSGRWEKVAPRQATVEELARVHTEQHIHRIANTAGKSLTALDGDTQTSADSYDISRLAVGGLFNLLDEIMAGNARRGFAFVRPPGHHADADTAKGFCLFNNIALGARHLHHRHGLSRVLIIDIDAHHGDGTQNVFYDTDEVLYISLHQHPSFPWTGDDSQVGSGKGEGYTVNIPLNRRRRDNDIARVLHFLALPLARQYRPEFVLVSCGFDLYANDPLCDMNVSPEGYGLLTAQLLELAEQVCRGNIVFVMEGGYSIKGIRKCGLMMMRELCGVAESQHERLRKIRNGSQNDLPELHRALSIQRRYWNIQ